MQLGQQQWPLMNQGNPLLGGAIPMALQQQMQGLMAGAYSGSYPQPGQFPMGDPGMLHRGQAHDKQLTTSSDRHVTNLLRLPNLVTPGDQADH